MEYNEEDAIAYIRTKLAPETAEAYDDDELLNVIDMIWDYYDDNGLLDINADIDDDDELNIDDLLAYVKKMVAKDHDSPLTVEDVEKIVKAELEYEDSLDL